MEPCPVGRPYRIVSGGQTGADVGALVGAELVGIETGGMAPKGYRTDAGPQLVLRDRFGLLAHRSANYSPRTFYNVHHSDATVVFGNVTSPGCRLTIRYCKQLRKPYLENPSAEELRRWTFVNQIGVLNVAGNRERTNPGIALHVARLIVTAFAPFSSEGLRQPYESEAKEGVAV